MPSSKHSIIELLRELITVLGGTPEGMSKIALYNQLALLSPGGGVTSLDPLTLSGDTAPENSANGTLVGTIAGRTPGSTLSLSNTAGGRFAIDSATGQITVANGSLLNREAASSHAIQVQEVLAGASNTPRLTDFVITVSNVLEVTLGALTVPSYSLPETAASLHTIGFISGTTSGSTVTLAASASGRVAIQEYSTGVWLLYVTSGLPVGTFDYETEPTVSITLRETHADGANSPRDTVIVLNVSDAAEADTTAPTLSSPSGSATSDSEATLGVTTNEANGTLYWVVTTSATAPTKAQVKTAQSHTGAPASDSGSQAISSTGAKAANATGLAAATTFYAHFMHEDASGNQSTVATSASFTTNAVALAALVLSNPSGFVAGTNPPSWQSDHDGDVEPWDSTASSGDKHQMRWRRVSGGAWTTEVYQTLDDELLSGGFVWPLFEAAQPLAAGLFEVEERRSRWVGGVMVGESDWSNTWSDTLSAPPSTVTSDQWRIRIDSIESGAYAAGAQLQLSVLGGGSFSDLAAGRPITASDTLGGYPVTNLVDGSAATLWHSNNTGFPKYVTVTLAATAQIKAFKWQTRDGGEWYQNPESGGVEYWNGSAWVEYWTYAFDYAANVAYQGASYVKEHVKP